MKNIFPLPPFPLPVLITFPARFPLSLLSVSLCSLTDEGEDDGEERCRGERERRVEFQHLEQLHDEDEDLVLRIPQQHRDGHRLQSQFRNG